MIIRQLLAIILSLSGSQVIRGREGREGGEREGILWFMGVLGVW